MEISNIIFKKIEIVIVFQQNPPYIHFYLIWCIFIFVKETAADLFNAIKWLIDRKNKYFVRLKNCAWSRQEITATESLQIRAKVCW